MRLGRTPVGDLPAGSLLANYLICAVVCAV